MKTSTKRKFPNKILKVSQVAKVLGHPARLAILQKLAQKKECICGDLVMDLPIAQATVSQHLKVLKDCGFIQGEIEGPKSKYCIDWKNFEQYKKIIEQWLLSLSKQGKKMHVR